MDSYILFFMHYSEYLKELGGFLNLTSFYNTVLRSLGWGIIRLLHRMCAEIEQIFYRMFDLLDILNNAALLEFLGSTGRIALALLAIPIVILGYRLITDGSFDGKKALRNVLYSIVVLITITGVVSMLSDLTRTGISEFSRQDTISFTLTTADQMVADNVLDLVYKYNSTPASEKKLGYLSGRVRDLWNDPNAIMTGDDIGYININELISQSIQGDDNPFAYRYSLDDSGNIQPELFPDRKTDIKWLDALIAALTDQQTSYARYYVDFFNLGLSLLSLSIAYFVAVYKICRIIFELVVSELLLQFSAVLDLSSGERTKKIVTNIVSCFLTLFGMAVLFRLYGIIYNYVISWSFLNEHHLIRTIAVVSFSFGILDGPDIIRKLLGIDVGMSDMAKNLQTAYYSGRILGAAGRMAGSVVGNVSSAAGYFSGAAAGSVAERSFEMSHAKGDGDQNGKSGGHPVPAAAPSGKPDSPENSAGSSQADSHMEESSTSSFDAESFAASTEENGYSETVDTESLSAETAYEAESGIDTVTEQTGETAEAVPDVSQPAADVSGPQEASQEAVSDVPCGDSSLPKDAAPEAADTSRTPSGRKEDSMENDMIAGLSSPEAADAIEKQRMMDNARYAREISDSVRHPGDLKDLLESGSADTPLRSFNEGYAKGYSETVRRRLKGFFRRNQR